MRLGGRPAHGVDIRLAVRYDDVYRGGDAADPIGAQQVREQRDAARRLRARIVRKSLGKVLRPDALRDDEHVAAIDTCLPDGCAVSGQRIVAFAAAVVPFTQSCAALVESKHGVAFFQQQLGQVSIRVSRGRPRMMDDEDERRRPLPGRQIELACERDPAAVEPHFAPLSRGAFQLRCR